jgi:hypothetical protein
MELNIEKIKKLMKTQKLTGYALAKRMKRQPNWVYETLKKDGPRSFGTVESFAKALNVKPTLLIKD